MDRKGICALLDEAEVEYQEHEDNVVVVLPGEKRLKTNCIFIPQQGTFRVEAFVCRKVEEAHEEVYRLLLQANRRNFGVHYTLDQNEDIYLVGQFPDSTTSDDVQQILGQVLERADADFNRILERGFASSIRHEWAWRLSRGEPTFNLAAFAHLKPSEAEVSLLAPPPGSKLASDMNNPSDGETEGNTAVEENAAAAESSEKEE
ncbi:YbjN domain-containing protein [Corynebacterium resistens]